MASKFPESASSADVVFESLIRPNRSMSERQSAVFVICFAVLSLTIALSFFSAGLWLVLPFAGFEILVVGVAIGHAMQRSRGYEWIVVTDSEVAVLVSRPGASGEYRFQRYWTQVRLESGVSRLHPDRLMVGSHGRFVEIGRELVEEDREHFAARLAEVVRNGRRQNSGNLKSREA